jgi:hypothetical protein
MSSAEVANADYRELESHGGESIAVLINIAHIAGY